VIVGTVESTATVLKAYRISGVRASLKAPSLRNYQALTAIRMWCCKSAEADNLVQVAPSGYKQAISSVYRSSYSVRYVSAAPNFRPVRACDF